MRMIAFGGLETTIWWGASWGNSDLGLGCIGIGLGIRSQGLGFWVGGFYK